MVEQLARHKQSCTVSRIWYFTMYVHELDLLKRRSQVSPDEPFSDQVQQQRIHICILSDIRFWRQNVTGDENRSIFVILLLRESGFFKPGFRIYSPKRVVWTKGHVMCFDGNSEQGVLYFEFISYGNSVNANIYIEQRSNIYVVSLKLQWHQLHQNKNTNRNFLERTDRKSRWWLVAWIIKGTFFAFSINLLR